jgi:hypothetical protein
MTPWRPAALAVALALAAPVWCRAEAGPSLSEVATNVETVVTTYILHHSAAGFWPVKPKGRGQPVRLRFDEIDKGSIEALSPGVYVSLVRVREAGSRKPRQAEFIVDLGGNDWRVASVHWLGPEERIDYRAAAKRAASAAPPRAPAAKHAAPKGPRKDTTGSLPDVGLTTLGGEKVLLTACPTEKCLVVVLSPWCPHCHNAAANIKALRGYIKEQGDATKIVVGKDSPAAVRQFAEEFGDDTLLDPEGAVPANGVPHFYAIYDGGGIIKEQGGAYEGAVDPTKWAGELGLP